MIVGEGSEDAVSRQDEQGGSCERDNHRPSEEVVAEHVGCLVTTLADEVSHKDVASLCDADAEEIDEHNHVVAVGSCCQCLVADLVDEEGDDHLREAVGDVLTHGRDADVQQVAQFLPWDGSEVAEWETWNVYLEMNDCKEHHGDGSAGSGGDGGSFYSHRR